MFLVVLKFYNMKLISVILSQHHLTNNWTMQCPLLLTALSAIRRVVKVLGYSVTSNLKQEVVAMVVDNLLIPGIRISPDTKVIKFTF